MVPSTRFDPHFGEDVCGTTVGAFFISPLRRSLGDVVGSLPRPSLPLMALSKETRHRLKLVWKDSVVFESRRFECFLKFIKKSIFPRESV